ncbi:hypothetical protein AB0N23_07875 [Streptomyces sp. NPDC052644]
MVGVAHEVRLGDELVVGLPLGSSRPTPLGVRADEGAVHRSFEAEANSGDTRALGVLAQAVAGVFAAAPDHETKPQATAGLSGWPGGAA